MYSNYGTNPQTIPYQANRVNSNIPSVQNQYSSSYSNDDRLIAGGFLGPFILGGITGGLLAPAFYGPGYGRPVYNTYYYPYQPYPTYYGPYYR